jgi:hypothetical protein
MMMRDGAKRFLAAASVLLMAACTSKDEDAGGGGGGGGNGGISVDADGNVSFEAYEGETYQPTFVVVDDANIPVKGADIIFDGQKVTTDETGTAPMPDQKVGETLTVQVQAKGFVPVTLPLTHQGPTASLTVNVSMTRERVYAVDAAAGGRIDLGNASVQLPGGGLIRQDGTVHTGNVLVTAVSGVAGEAGSDWLTGSPSVEKSSGATYEPAIGGIYVKLSDDKGDELAIAKGESARVALPLPTTTKAKEGDVMPLRSFDDKKGAWSEEGTCTVQMDSALGNQKACVGQVEHFSRWSVPSIWSSPGSAVNRLKRRKRGAPFVGP